VQTGQRQCAIGERLVNLLYPFDSPIGIDSAHVQSRLINIGYAKEVLGAIVLTDDGLQRIAMGR
jgi:hypothetical protein